MRPGVVRNDGDVTGRTFAHIQKQAVIFRAANTLILRQGPHQLSCPLRVNQRQDAPAVGIRRRGTGGAAGCFKRVALRETISGAVCRSGKIDRRVQRRRYEHVDDMGSQVTGRDKPIRPQLALNRKIPGLRLRRTQMLRHHRELPKWRKLGVRVEDRREWAPSRVPRPWIVKPRVIPDDIQAPWRRDGCPQVHLPVDIIVSNAGRRP